MNGVLNLHFVLINPNLLPLTTCVIDFDRRIHLFLIVEPEWIIASARFAQGRRMAWQNDCLLLAPITLQDFMEKKNV